MSLGKSIVLVTCGGVAGVLLVMSCSDSPPHADAAVCDCPAAEPPLTASRYEIRDSTFTIPASGTGGTSVGCSTGALFVSGSCTTATLNPIKDVTLQQAGFYEQAEGWNCRFRNNETTPVEIKASIVCLKPAP